MCLYGSYQDENVPIYSIPPHVRFRRYIFLRDLIANAIIANVRRAMSTARVMVTKEVDTVSGLRSKTPLSYGHMVMTTNNFFLSTRHIPLTTSQLRPLFQARNIATEELRVNTATVTIASANTGSGRRATVDAKDTRNDQEVDCRG